MVIEEFKILIKKTYSSIQSEKIIEMLNLAQSLNLNHQ